MKSLLNPMRCCSLVLIVASSAVVASSQENSDSPSCTISSTNVNLRSGPSTESDLEGTLTTGQDEAVDGQTLGSDGQVWWHLSSGAWVRSDVVEEAGSCETVPPLLPDGTPLTLYDDFNNPDYEGRVNEALWDASEGCEIAQHDGAVVFMSDLTDEPVFCAIWLPETIPAQELGGLQAKLRISSDVVSDGGAVLQEVGIQSVNLPDETYWHVQCQLESGGNGVRASLEGMHWNGDNLDEHFRIELPTPLAFDTWYTLRAEIDAANMIFSCYLDEQLIGSVVPTRADELHTVEFMRHIKTDRSANTTATTFADDVQVILPSSEMDASTLYDSFDDPTYDSTYNPTLWTTSVFHPFCQAEQKEGVLVFNYLTPQGDFHDCSLMAKQPYLISLDELGSFVARIQIASDHTGGYVSQRLVIFNEEPGGTWGAYCGLQADESVQAFFWQWQQDRQGQHDIDVQTPAEYDRWYTIRIEVDPQTFTFSCYVDGTLLGFFVPSDLENLKKSQFRRTLEAGRMPNATANTYVDDVRIIPQPR